MTTKFSLVVQVFLYLGMLGIERASWT